MRRGINEDIRKSWKLKILPMMHRFVHIDILNFKDMPKFLTIIVKSIPTCFHAQLIIMAVWSVSGPLGIHKVIDCNKGSWRLCFSGFSNISWFDNGHAVFHKKVVRLVADLNFFWRPDIRHDVLLLLLSLNSLPFFICRQGRIHFRVSMYWHDWCDYTAQKELVKTSGVLAQRYW